MRRRSRESHLVVQKAVVIAKASLRAGLVVLVVVEAHNGIIFWLSSISRFQHCLRARIDLEIKVTQPWTSTSQAAGYSPKSSLQLYSLASVTSNKSSVSV